ncbi:MAG TPA: phospholipase D-like domain-containing protein [Thermoanaerobaculia bacterium]|jgi:cardiolipin synthase
MRAIPVPLWVLVLLGLTIAILVVLLWSVKRRRRPRLHLDTEDDFHGLIPSIVGLTQGTMVHGNKIELVQNGAFFDWLFRDLETAQKSISFETFLAKEGEVTHRLADLFCRKATGGVKVRLMLDGSGGRLFGRADLKKMQHAGVDVRKYHPVRFSTLGVLNNRDHRKIVIVDGRIGYVGGHCLVDTWLGDAEDKQHFRDISARVEGPVIAQLQSAFAENWIEESGDVLAGEEYFPETQRAGDMDAHAVWISPSGSPSAVKLLHYLVIRAAKKSITIQNPYFLPDPDARTALLDAARRGVKVRIMIPADTASDAPMVQHASHHHYGTLLKGGVQLFDYERTLLHQKVITVDGCWAAVGSTNFDDRSFEVNDEITLVVYNEAIAQELEATFERDLAHAKQVAFEQWKRRPALHKLRDFAMYVFNEQM